MNAQKILVVDDDEKIRHLLENSLTEAGYTVYTAESAEEGMNFFSGHKDIKVFFLDLRLPETNGIELCKQIKQARPTSILHAITGYTSVYDLVECRAAGFEDYFIKPFKVKDIIKAAENAFARIEKWQKEHPAS